MIRTTRWAVVGSALALAAACSDPALQKKVEDLESKVATLEKKVEEGAAAPAATKAAPPQNNEEAMALFKEASEAQQKGDTETAKAKYKELTEKHAGSRAAAAAARQLAELNVVGKEVSELKTEEWFQGEVALADGKASLIIFWEVWCPHCKREVPKLQGTYDKYKDRGLNVIGLTKMTRNKTPEDVRNFITENKVGYPIAREAGDMSATFGVSGVPAAAVVKDGKVVWRGHPAQLTDDMIEAWL